MKKDFIKPILVLTIICLVMSAALAYTNGVTEPIINKASEERAQLAMSEIIPQADSFEKINGVELCGTVTEAYSTSNKTGYIFMMTATGYGGKMSLICGIDNDGRIIACRTLAHNETKGLGSKTAEEPFRDQFAGAGSSLDGVSAITGATISSTAYIGAIQDAFTTFATVKEAGK